MREKYGISISKLINIAVRVGIEKYDKSKVTIVKQKTMKNCLLKLKNSRFSKLKQVGIDNKFFIIYKTIKIIYEKHIKIYEINILKLFKTVKIFFIFHCLEKFQLNEVCLMYQA